VKAVIAIDCFQHDSVNWNSRVATWASVVRTCAKIFFIIFVDGIFTTFIARLFTNTSHAIRENPVMSCV
jgi:hypothetical protein